MIKKIAVLILFFFVVSVIATEVEIVPYASGILINGFENEMAWAYPNCVDYATTNGVIFRLVQDSQFVYIFIKTVTPVHTGIDLYIDDYAGKKYVFHVSSALADKVMIDTVWSEYKWAENKNWTANVIQSIYEDGENKYIVPECFEFQIDKKYFPNIKFGLKAHLKRPDEIAPPENSPHWPGGWIEIELDR